MGLRLSSLTLSSLAKPLPPLHHLSMLALAAVIVPDLSNAGRNWRDFIKITLFGSSSC